jgi:hypothetical protein
MAYLYAQSTFERINGDAVTIKIIHNIAGADTSVTFDVDPVGYTLEYVGEDDKHLRPGIMGSKCTINTIWDNVTYLNTLIGLLTIAEEGDWIVQMYAGTSSDPFWTGVIISDQFEILESSEIQTCKIVATDGLAMLKQVKYNHSKWILFDYLNNQYNGTLLPRFKISDDVVSTDQDNYSTHPSGTNMRVWQKTRLHNKTFYNKNEAGVNQYRNCYENWAFVPVALSDSDLTGYTERWNSTFVDDTQTVDAWSFQTDDIQKGALWVRTLSAPANKVSLTRNLKDIYKLITLGEDYTLGDIVQAPEYTYQGQDTLGDQEIRYKVSGRFYVAWTGDDTRTGDDILGRFMLRFRWRWNTATGAYFNVLKNYALGVPLGTAFSQYLTDESTFNDVDYTKIYEGITLRLPTTDSSSYEFLYKHDNDNRNYQYHYSTRDDGTAVVDFNFFVSSPPQACNTFDFSADIRPYNFLGEFDSQAYNSQWSVAKILYCDVLQVQADEATQLASFDYNATTPTGRDEIKMGTTYIGDVGIAELIGGIEVYNGTSYDVSGQWVSQAQSSARSINRLAVEEILAMHKYSRALERGLIIANDVSTYPRPFDRFNDSDTGFYYAPLTWKQYGSMIEHDVTLFKLGRNFNDVNFEADENNATRRDGGGGFQTDGGENAQGKPEVFSVSFVTESRNIFEAWDTSTVGGGATLEMYYTVSTNGQGKYILDQGQDPPTDYEIERTIYVVDEAVADHNDSGWQTPSALQPVQLLDTYTDAVVGYSLRRLRTAYTGNCITVRRTVNPASQDIGFDSEGNLDTTALLAFCGAGDGYVTKWYDQVGTNHLLQTTVANQPQIVNAGTVRTLNGKPALYFDGSNDSLGLTSLSPNPDGHFTMATVSSTRSGSTGQAVVSSWSSSTSTQNFMQFYLATGAGRVAYRFDNGQLPRNDTGTLTTNTQYIVTAHYARDEADAYFNGTYYPDAYSTSISTADPENNANALRVGARSHDLGIPLDGMVQEVVLWSQPNHDHDPSEISDSINAYYEAY